MTATSDRTAGLRERYAEAIRERWSALPDFEMDALLLVVMHVRDAEVDRLSNQVADQQRQIEALAAVPGPVRKGPEQSGPSRTDPDGAVPEPTVRVTRYQESDDITFVRYQRTGTVHLLPPPADPFTTEDRPFANGQEFAEAVTSRTAMLCGQRIPVDWTEASDTAGVPDAPPIAGAALCRACMNVMGNDAWLVFDYMRRCEAAGAR